MAKLMLIGEVAHVELTSDPEDGQTIATCVEHAGVPSYNFANGCTWTERYDTTDDAWQYAESHADGGR